MSIEAMKQALEALEICAVRQDHQWHGLQQVSIAKAALRQAIEQAEKREWVGLTEDEAIELLPVGNWEIEPTLEFAKVIEQALKEKNT